MWKFENESMWIVKTWKFWSDKMTKCDNVKMWKLEIEKNDKMAKCGNVRISKYDFLMWKCDIVILPLCDNLII